MQKFFTGDVVRYTGAASWIKGQTHIIKEASYQGEGTFEYSTDRGAWFVDTDFTLIRRADRASFKELDKCILDNEGE